MGRELLFRANQQNGALHQTTQASWWAFRDDFLAGLTPTSKMDLRSQSRGVVLLNALLADWPLPSSTAVYLACQAGPYSPKARAVAEQCSDSQRLAQIERVLPPKDYFIANPAMKAAQISQRFGLHGPWSAFVDPVWGLAQALECANRDLESKRVDSALVAATFTLEEPDPSRLGELTEFVFASWAVAGESLPQTPLDLPQP